MPDEPFDFDGARHALDQGKEDLARLGEEAQAAQEGVAAARETADKKAQEFQAAGAAQDRRLADVLAALKAEYGRPEPAAPQRRAPAAAPPAARGRVQ